jgi:flagellar biosynthesis/type III secretory pathway ATPase
LKGEIRVVDGLLVPPIGKRLPICARFGLGDKILVHLMVNVKMTSVQFLVFRHFSL